LQKFILPILVLVTFVTGSLSSTQIDSWYFSLNKAYLNPPGYVFGIVWPILYLLMAIVGYLNSNKIFKPFLIQLFLNGVWSWLFFAWHLPLIALFDILLLIGVNVFIFQKLDTGSKLMHAPYLAWLSFATYLNAGIVFLN
jgi:benzodiazapine receptor